jgi:hypothetical protein
MAPSIKDFETLIGRQVTKGDLLKDVEGKLHTVTGDRKPDNPTWVPTKTEVGRPWNFSETSDVFSEIIPIEDLER